MYCKPGPCGRGTIALLIVPETWERFSAERIWCALPRLNCPSKKPTLLEATLTDASYTKAELEQLVQSAGFWWHSIDLGQGVVTPGRKSSPFLAKELAALKLPSLAGKTVLDIGAFSGYYSFAAERLGAKRVVALDHYVWSIDLVEFTRYVADCRARGVAAQAAPQTRFWNPAHLPGKRPYDVAHHALGSRVETVIGDFMDMDLRPLGTFDVTLFLGVLYHMEDPLGSLRRLFALTRELAVIETHAVSVHGYENHEICEFYSGDQLSGDPSNWWSPNLKALQGMCKAAGFSRVEIVAGQRKARRLALLRSVLPCKQPQRFRAVVHAWK